MAREASFDSRKLMEKAIEMMRESVIEPRANLGSRQESRQCVGIQSLRLVGSRNFGHKIGTIAF